MVLLELEDMANTLLRTKGPVNIVPNEAFWVQNPQFWSDFETVFFPVTVET